MPSYTVVLSDTQDTALQYWTETTNAQRATQQDEAGAPLPALTPAEALHERVASDLASVLRNLDSGLLGILDNVRQLSAGAQAEVLDTVPSAATRDRLVQLLQGA